MKRFGLIAEITQAQQLTDALLQAVSAVFVPLSLFGQLDAKQIPVPVIVGPGIQSLDEADRLFEAGAARLCLSQEDALHTDLVRRVSYKHGADATLCWIQSSTKAAQKAKEQGAGELILESGDFASHGLPCTAYMGDATPAQVLQLANCGAQAALVSAKTDVAAALRLLQGAGFGLARAGEFDLSAVKFDENGLVPAIAQDIFTGKVLMLAYMNKASLLLTLESGFATYFSRSRQRLWKKGESSGHVQRVRELFYDCDGDTLLLKVEQSGPACHTGQESCFYRPLVALPGGRSSTAGAGILAKVYGQVQDRKQNPKEGSYTNKLLAKGVDLIGKKLLEEAAETLIAAKNQSREELLFESADLVYHLLVLLADASIAPDELYAELESRHR